MTTISCIVPTHRRPEYLQESLTSIMNQSMTVDEIVVVSDVADEQSADVCRRLSSTSTIPVTYLENLEQSGAAASRNFGATLATSEYLAFLDDDDLWDERYVESAVARLTSTGTDMVVTWLEEFSGTDRRDGESMAEGLRAQDAAAMNPGATGSNVIVLAAAFWRVGGYDILMRVKNDTDFLFRFLRSGGSYSTVQERLVYQRKHTSGQLTAKTEMRAAGTELYLAKHIASLSAADIRVLRLYAHRIRAHSSTAAAMRLFHRASMLAYYTPAELWGRMRRGPNTRHFDVRGYQEPTN